MKEEATKNKGIFKGSNFAVIANSLEIRDDIYIKMNKKQKMFVLKKIEKILSNYGIKNYLLFGSFLNRKWFRDIDIVIFDNIKEDKIIEISAKIESEIGIEVDIKHYKEIPLPVKFSLITSGVGKIDNKLRASSIDFVRSYIDFIEWFKARNG
ncbi:MAG: hypothetical protein QXL09_02995 [Candidatus Aenigmatarchaeota archaeon]